MTTKASMYEDDQKGHRFRAKTLNYLVVKQ